MSITKALARGLANSDRKTSIASQLRAKRIAPLLEMIEAAFDNNGSVSLIDIGGTQKYWDIIPNEFLDKHNVSIVIVNLPGTIMPDHGRFRFVAADACDLTHFGDRSFHIAHSNSVVEHVGDWERMVSFASEVVRVASRHFVQTPNYWFPIEPHCMTPFFHWLPKPLRIWLVMRFQLGHWKKAASTDEAVRIVESARLLNKKMLQALFKDSEIVTERFFGLPKSFIALKKA